MFFFFNLLVLVAVDEEALLIKPRARSTASGKKIPAGAVSIFGGRSSTCIVAAAVHILITKSFRFV